ncbi:MAG: lipoyl(octanoyl) transferase LipB [Pseudomonadota bacterium]
MSNYHIHYLGIQPYHLIWDKMKSFTENRTSTTADEIWLLQHPAIFTLGRNCKAEHLLNPGDITTVSIDRGGQVTYHGPGQLIAYTMIDLKRLGIGVRELVSRIENVLIAFLSYYQINAFAKKQAPGVYTERGKIAALGLRISKSCSFHGLSLNVCMQLEPFTRINPCGYKDLNIVQLVDYQPQIILPEVIYQLKQSLINEIYQ